eukprot:m.217529 g.217529  ORF g.217529 m.217529 type:complete len:60 (-) comp15887_c0_seq5:732-911(-)
MYKFDKLCMVPANMEKISSRQYNAESGLRNAVVRKEQTKNQNSEYINRAQAPPISCLKV